MARQLQMVARASLLIAAAAILTIACSSPTTNTPSAQDLPSSTATSTPMEADGEYEPPGSAATWDQSAAQAAAAAATNAMTLFISHPGDEQQWWAQLQPLLSTTAAYDYAGTDPANVPARRLTGPPVVQPDTSTYLATAVVPTDVGDYQLLLSRRGGDAPWLVERLTPPADAEAAGTRR